MIRMLAILGAAVCGAVYAETPRATLLIHEECGEFIPLFDAIPVNDTQVTALVHRESDDAVIGAACGKEQIALFKFDVQSGAASALDVFEALWWDEPRLALGPDGAVYLGARRTYDKQFVFERLHERPHTPGLYDRRNVEPDAAEVNEDAPGMPIRCYAPDGQLRAEYPLPAPLAQDGVGALIVTTGGAHLAGITSPGGNLFTIDLATGAATDHGNVVRPPYHHHFRPISRVMMEHNGWVYFSGFDRSQEYPGASEYPYDEFRDEEDQFNGFIQAFHPGTGELRSLEARLPAVDGRRGLAAVDAVVRLADGTFLGGVTDGYLFRFDPRTETVENFGKPLRQHNINGLALSPDGWVYGAGGEPGGLPRLFAFDPVRRTFELGMPPTGRAPGQSYGSFGDIGGVVITRGGVLVCAERERRGYLLLYRPAE